MRMLVGIVAGCLLALTGCECAYGGAGCDLPSAMGLCSPTIQVEVPTTFEVDYGDDTGGHPVTSVHVAFVSDPTLLMAWDDGVAEVTVLGAEVGHAAVALEIEGWDQRGVIPFKITAEPPPSCESEYGETPGFAIQLSE